MKSGDSEPVTLLHEEDLLSRRQFLKIDIRVSAVLELPKRSKVTNFNKLIFIRHSWRE